MEANVNFHLADPRNPIKPNAEDLTIVLESERNAWAFALKKMDTIKELLNITREEILTYIHEEALASYSAKMRALIESGLRQ